jgi:hypothetical protein
LAYNVEAGKNSWNETILVYEKKYAVETKV